MLGFEKSIHWYTQEGHPKTSFLLLILYSKCEVTFGRHSQVLCDAGRRVRAILHSEHVYQRASCVCLDVTEAGCTKKLPFYVQEYWQCVIYIYHNFVYLILCVSHSSQLTPWLYITMCGGCPVGESDRKKLLCFTCASWINIMVCTSKHCKWSVYDMSTRNWFA